MTTLSHPFKDEIKLPELSDDESKLVDEMFSWYVYYISHNFFVFKYVPHICFVQDAWTTTVSQLYENTCQSIFACMPLEHEKC